MCDLGIAKFLKNLVAHPMELNKKTPTVEKPSEFKATISKRRGDISRGWEGIVPRKLIGIDNK